MSFSHEEKCNSPVHPHVRGEHVYLIPSASIVNGSSPRAWGALVQPFVYHVHQRFIPTCVGSILTVFSVQRPVHGSSPRAWGAFGVRRRVAADERFIPTCVGSIPSGPKDNATRPVHPHVRGEHRGRRDVGGPAYRFIPTCVGSMDARRQLFEPLAGSSPRAWGALFGNRFNRFRPRFIPTCVGSMP